MDNNTFHYKMEVMKREVLAGIVLYKNFKIF